MKKIKRIFHYFIIDWFEDDSKTFYLLNEGENSQFLTTEKKHFAIIDHIEPNNEVQDFAVSELAW